MGISKSSTHRILKRQLEKIFAKISHARNEDNFDGKVQFCEWYLAEYEDEA